jgi:hypothetical protein
MATTGLHDEEKWDVAENRLGGVKLPAEAM